MLLAHSILFSGNGEELAFGCTFTEVPTLATGETAKFQLCFVLKVRESVRQKSIR